MNDKNVAKDREFLEVIKERAAKLNLSRELLDALETHHTARKSNSDAVPSSDVTSFLTSLLGTFLPVFDSTSLGDDGQTATSRRPYKIVEVENKDQIVPLEVMTGYSQVRLD